jgi:hypothetical protein
MPDNSQSCWFVASAQDALLIGGIFPTGTPAGNPPVATVTVHGNNSTPFVVAPGVYRYEFNVAAGTKFDLTLFVHGEKTDCDPRSFDMNDGGGSIDRVTVFKVT